MTVTLFAKLPNTVAENWTSTDKETKEYSATAILVLVLR